MSEHKARRRSTARLLVTALLLTCGCGDAEPTPEPSGERPSSAAPLPEVVASGEALVRVEGQRVTVIAAGATLGSVLRRLAREAGFALDAVEDVEQPTTVRIEGSPLREALAELLAGLAYEARWSYEPQRGAHRLVSLRVGSATQPVQMLEDGGRGEGNEETLAARLARRQPGRGKGFEEGAGGTREPARVARDEGPDLSRLESVDPRDRRAAVEGLSPEGSELDLLLEMAAEDPDPQVRAEAVDQLAEGEGFAVTRALLSSLADPDWRVVVRAIEALELLQDETLLPELEPLLDHADADVRRAAADAIESLGDE